MLNLNSTPNFPNLETVGDRPWGEVCPWKIFGVNGMLTPGCSHPGKLPILIPTSRSGSRLRLRTSHA